MIPSVDSDTILNAIAANSWKTSETYEVYCRFKEESKWVFSNVCHSLGNTHYGQTNSLIIGLWRFKEAERAFTPSIRQPRAGPAKLNCIALRWRPLHKSLRLDIIIIRYRRSDDWIAAMAIVIYKDSTVSNL